MRIAIVMVTSSRRAVENAALYLTKYNVDDGLHSDHRGKTPLPLDVSPVGRLLRRVGADVLPGRRLSACPQDVLLGQIAGSDFYIGAAQFAYWEHTQLIIDVVPGRGSGFSVEAPEGLRFLTRSRVFSYDEAEALRHAGPPARAA